jgi:hypothetical protein
MSEFNIELPSRVVDVIISALHTHAGELAAREARRTGGRGFASGGVSRQVQDAHYARSLLVWARLRTHEWRRNPSDGKTWRITGSDDLNYTLREVTTGESMRTAKIPVPEAQRPADWPPAPWHSWEVVPMDMKQDTPPEGWYQ